MRRGPVYRHLQWLLIASLPLAGCTDIADQPGGNLGLLEGGADAPGDSTEGTGTGQESDPLLVDLGADRAINANELVVIEAELANSQGGELFFLWEYQLIDHQITTAEATLLTAQTEDFVKDWNAVTFYPQDIFPSRDLGGAILRIRANVMEIGATTRTGAGEITLSIALGDVELPDREDGEESDVPALDEGDSESQGDDEETGIFELDSGGNTVVVTPDDPDEDESSPPPDPCDGISVLTVLPIDPITMSLYQGSINLQATVCSGTEPYSYNWTPATNLEDPGSGFGGGPSGTVTSSDADFTPPATGAYDITVTVTDDNADTAAQTINISVNSYDPLIANAGADQAATQGDALNLTGSVLGGSGAYSYAWTPSGPSSATFTNVPTSQLGETTYTLTVTDTNTSLTATDTVQVVVLSAGGSCVDDDDLSVISADFVAFDAGYGSAGQAVVVSGDTVILFDLQSDTVRARLSLPASGQGLVVDSTRRRAMVTSRLSGLFTRSVQIIDLDNAVLGANIGLTDNVAFARGMAVIPSTGDVIVAVSGASGSDGLMVVSPGSATLSSALQNMHHTDSFQQPVQVTVLEQGALNVAVVANLSGSYLTLVPLADITFTADDSTGGGLSTLPQIALNGAPRTVVSDASNSRVITGWNDAGSGRVNVVTISDNQSGSAGADILLSGSVVDQGLSIDVAGGRAFAAMGSDNVAVLDLTFGVEAEILQGTPTARSVAFETGVADRILIVGTGSDLSERCP